MTDYPFRFQILSVVSSEAQAAPDLSSLPLQTERSRAAAAPHWIEAAPPIEIAESRRRYSLQQLRHASAEIDQLCQRVERAEVDLLITRDQTRLGRYESLQHELLAFLEQKGVQVYFYSAPQPPVAPEQFRAAGGYDMSRRLIHAVGAVQAQHEVDTLVQRHRDGMAAHARAGRWRRAQPPLGYERQVLGEQPDGTPIYGPGLVRVEAIRRVILAAARRYADGASLRELAGWHQQTAPDAPASYDGNYGRIRGYLTNPAYVGVMVYGRSRAGRTTRHDGTLRRRDRRIVTAARATDLAEAWLDGVDERTEAEQRAGVIVAWGQWPPMFADDTELALWRLVQRERRARTAAPAAVGTPRPGGNARLLSGILHCDHCGGTMGVVNVTRNKGARAYVYYGCLAHLYATRAKQPSPCWHNRANADALRHDLFATLVALAADTDALRASLVPRVGATTDARARWEAQAAEAERALENLLPALESGALPYAMVERRAAQHRAALDEAEEQLRALRRRTAPPVDPDTRVRAIQQLVAELPALAAENPQHLKVLLRRYIARVTVRDRALHSVALRR